MQVKIAFKYSRRIVFKWKGLGRVLQQSKQPTGQSPSAAGLVADEFWRKFFVANPTKNVTDPLLAFCAPNCLIKERERH